MTGEHALSLLDDPQEYDPDLRLLLAVLYDNPDGVETALDAGADPRLRDPEGSSVLAHALRAGATDAVAVLLKRGADPADLPDADHLHPVAIALRAAHHRFDLAAALLAGGVTLNPAGHLRPPVADAVERNDAEGLRWLLAQGGWPGEARGRLLISRARSRGLTELADMLVLEAARRGRPAPGLIPPPPVDSPDPRPVPDPAGA